MRKAAKSCVRGFGGKFSSMAGIPEDSINPSLPHII
jgi:hypothetical protein